MKRRLMLLTAAIAMTAFSFAQTTYYVEKTKIINWNNVTKKWVRDADTQDAFFKIVISNDYISISNKLKTYLRVYSERTKASPDNSYRIYNAVDKSDGEEVLVKYHPGDKDNFARLECFWVGGSSIGCIYYFDDLKPL